MEKYRRIIVPEREAQLLIAPINSDLGLCPMFMGTGFDFKTPN